MDHEDKKQDTTHFGFEQVAVSEKASRVAEVFHSVAGRYDVMNDVMSLGTHRVMKQMAANATHARPGHTILDLAGGTGDLAVLLADYVGKDGQVCVCDINASMLASGRDRLLDRGLIGNVSFVQGDGERLPFADNTFNAVTLAFGLRNFTDKQAALLDIWRCLKPGSKLVVLEFSKPENPLVKSAYSGFRRLWPGIGKLVTGDEDSYRYLVESIEMHPDQESLRDLMTSAGFSRARYHNLLNGIAAIHEGIKPGEVLS